MTAAVIVVLAAHLAAMRFAAGVIPSPVLLPFFFVTTVMVPGYIAAQSISPVRSIYLKVLLSFLYGTAISYILLTVFSIFSFDIVIIGLILPVASAVMLILRIAGRIVSPAGRADDHVPADDRSKAAPLILLVLLIAATVLVLYQGDQMIWTSDSYDHVAYIRTVARTHEAFPRNFLYEKGGMLTRDIRKGLSHAMWGSLIAMTGSRDVAGLWVFISLTGSIFILIAFYCSGLLLFRSRAIGLLSSISFLLFYNGGLTGYQLITIAYSFPFGKIFSVIFISALALSIRSGRKDHLALAAVSSLAATGTHIGHFFICWFLIAVFWIAELFSRREPDRGTILRRRIPLSAAAVASFNALYLAMRYFRDYAPSNVLHSHIQALLNLPGNMAILNPVVFIRSAGYLALIPLLSILVLFRAARADRTLRLLLWGTAATYVLLFNPIWVRFIMERISYLLIRMEFAVPSVLITAYLLWELWRKVSGGRSTIGKIGLISSSIAVVLILGGTLVQYPARFAYTGSQKRQMKKYSALGMSELFDFLDRDLPEGSVIMSDPVTSYSIPAFTDHYVTCTFDQHSIPNDSTALDRILDSREFFFFAASPGELRHILDKYEVDFVVNNGGIPRWTYPMYWSPDLKSFGRVDSLFSRMPGFSVVFSGPRFTIYSVARSMMPLGAPEGRLHPDFVGEEVTPQSLERMHRSGIDGIFISEVVIPEGAVSRGERCDIGIEWVAGKRVGHEPLVATVRFNREFEKGSLYRPMYGKLYRKLLEMVRSERYRFGIPHIPFQGQFPPDKWPLMRIISDRVHFTIPVDIAPGEYEVSVKLTIKTQYPNYRLSDLLRDEDIYEGETTGRITIE